MLELKCLCFAIGLLGEGARGGEEAVSVTCQHVWTLTDQREVVVGGEGGQTVRKTRRRRNGLREKDEEEGGGGKVGGSVLSGHCWMNESTEWVLEQEFKSKE